MRLEAGQTLIDGGCLVIAEVAQSHDGSLGMAHAFIDAAAAAGAGAIKFQTHFAAEESTLADQRAVAEAAQGAGAPTRGNRP